MSRAYKATYNLFVAHGEIEFYRYVYARNMTYLLYRLIDSEQASDEDKIKILADLRWFFKLSKTLNVQATQKSLSILIDMIIQGKLDEAMIICKIIGELRNIWK